MNEPGKKTIDDALVEIVSTAADKAAERVLQHAATARIEVEQELMKITEERRAMILEVSQQVERAAAKSDLALADHTMLEMKRFSAIETQLTIAATQITASAASLVQISCDVKSLLATRSFTQGGWKMLTKVAVVVSAGIAAIAAFFNIKWPWGH